MVNSKRSLGVLAMVALFGSGIAAQAPAAKPGADKAMGLFPVTTQSSLVIRGIPGQIVVMAKPTRELRYTSKATLCLMCWRWWRDYFGRQAW